MSHLKTYRIFPDKWEKNWTKDELLDGRLTLKSYVTNKETELSIREVSKIFNLVEIDSKESQGFGKENPKPGSKKVAPILQNLNEQVGITCGNTCSGLTTCGVACYLKKDFSEGRRIMSISSLFAAIGFL